MKTGSTHASPICPTHRRILAIGLALLATSPSFADETGATIEEIVVTAQKRVENAKDVPVSISELSGDFIKSQHITDFDDLTRTIPSVSFASGGTEGLSNIEMRGVSSGVGSPTVAVYLDESSITVDASGPFVGQAQPIPFDLARVEVLRGPQGTLYGASSMGGAIRFITNQPKLDEETLDINSDLSGTNYAGVNYNESIVVNAPLSPDLAVRVGLDYGENAGWIDHYNYLTGAKDQSNINKVEQGVVKIAFLYKPNENLTITPSFWAQQVLSKDSDVFYPDLGMYDTSKEVREPSKDRMYIPSLKIDENLGSVDLTSITSYFWRYNRRLLDGTYFNDAAFAYYFLDYNPQFASHQAQNDSIIAHIPSPSYVDNKNVQFTEELRASSPKGGSGELPLSWTAGLYYSTVSQQSENNEFSPGLNSAFQSIYGYPLSSPIAQQALGSTATTFAGDVIYIAPITQKIDEYSAFGQLNYDVLQSLHVSGGVRFEHSTQSYVSDQSGFYALSSPAAYASSTSSNSTTPKFSLVYDLTDTSTAYASVAKGYRLGGGTGPIPESLCAGDLKNIGESSAPNSYQNDSLWSYELGTKLLIDDRRLSIDLAAYLIHWKNIQQEISLPDCGFGFVDNFGDALNVGGELQVQYKPSLIPNLTLGLNAGGGKSVITRSIDPEAAAVGEHTLFAPEWTGTALADYKVVFSDVLSGIAHIDYDYTGMSYGSFQSSDPGYQNPGYGVLNGSIGIEAGSLKVSLYGKNLANNQTIIQRPNVADIYEGYTVRPMTIGVNLSKQFR